MTNFNCKYIDEILAYIQSHTHFDLYIQKYKYLSAMF